MTIEYRPSLFAALSCLYCDGIFYHQVGDYHLNYSNQILTPVNRSYVQAEEGLRKNSQDPGYYKKDLLVHERVSDGATLFPKEKLIDVYQKLLLFLSIDQDVVWFEARDIDKRISVEARELLDRTREALGRFGYLSPYHLGVFGSHRIGLNGLGSDVDIIAWVLPNERRRFIDLILKAWQMEGYRTAKELGKNDEHAQRYAKRFNLPINIGYYLAEKRVRFITPKGVSVSLQCLSDWIDHQTIANFLEGLDDLWESEEVNFDCEVISANASYNFPKLWKIGIGSSLFDLISFSWMHQGMGDDEGRFGKKYILRAARITNSRGVFFYMRDASHYLIPRKLFQS